MYDRNSREALTRWMEESLSNSDITEHERAMLKKVGLKIVDAGGRRGSVSEAWIALGFHSDRIHDLYP